MSKRKPKKKNQELGEKVARRILAHVRIIDSGGRLREIQRQMRGHAQIFSKLERQRAIPDVALRELLAKLKERDLTLADQITDIRDNLDFARELLKAAA